MAKKMKAAERAPRSGWHEMVGPRAGSNGHERTMVRGEPLPPTSKLGRSYALRAGSGRYIITSPAKSANTVTTWSRAFKKK